MTLSDWTRPESPFHSGELALQTRARVRERLDRQGRRVIREFLPEQHRQFFAQLAYAIAGTVDASGNLWASILVGKPGFLSSPNNRSLQVRAKPLFGDPLATTLTEGIDIGLLGIELSTRRRNRLNGIVAATDGEGFAIRVRQSFGNCPQYIQARSAVLEDFDPTAAKPIQRLEKLGEEERSAIATADTFFIATAYQDAAAGRASGVDVSHRGGKPGFIKVNGDRLTIPDFAGNNYFNTLGNLELNPRAGLLFVDFDRGDLLYLTGTATITWEGAEVLAYEGAERLLHFQLEGGYRVEGSLPLRWSAPEFSPVFDRLPLPER